MESPVSLPRRSVGEKIPVPPRNPLPLKDVPGWSKLPYDTKYPMPRNSKNIDLSREDLGQSLFPTVPFKDFDLSQSSTPFLDSPGYSSLHDPHLRGFFQSQSRYKALVRKGLITEDGRVKAGLREYNQYRMYLYHLWALQVNQLKELQMAEEKNRLESLIKAHECGDALFREIVKKYDRIKVEDVLDEIAARLFETDEALLDEQDPTSPIVQSVIRWRRYQEALKKSFKQSYPEVKRWLSEQSKHYKLMMEKELNDRATRERKLESRWEKLYASSLARLQQDSRLRHQDAERRRTLWTDSRQSRTKSLHESNESMSSTVEMKYGVKPKRKRERSISTPQSPTTEDIAATKLHTMETKTLEDENIQEIEKKLYYKRTREKGGMLENVPSPGQQVSPSKEADSLYSFVTGNVQLKPRGSKPRNIKTEDQFSVESGSKTSIAAASYESEQEKTKVLTTPQKTYKKLSISESKGIRRKSSDGFEIGGKTSPQKNSRVHTGMLPKIKSCSDLDKTSEKKPRSITKIDPQKTEMMLSSRSEETVLDLQSANMTSSLQTNIINLGEGEPKVPDAKTTKLSSIRCKKGESEMVSMPDTENKSLESEKPDFWEIMRQSLSDKRKAQHRMLGLEMNQLIRPRKEQINKEVLKYQNDRMAASKSAPKGSLEIAEQERNEKSEGQPLIIINDIEDDHKIKQGDSLGDDSKRHDPSKLRKGKLDRQLLQAMKNKMQAKRTRARRGQGEEIEKGKNKISDYADSAGQSFSISLGQQIVVNEEHEDSIKQNNKIIKPPGFEHGTSDDNDPTIPCFSKNLEKQISKNLDFDCNFELSNITIKPDFEFINPFMLKHTCKNKIEAIEKRYFSLSKKITKQSKEYKADVMAMKADESSASQETKKENITQKENANESQIHFEEQSTILFNKKQSRKENVQEVKCENNKEQDKLMKLVENEFEKNIRETAQVKPEKEKVSKKCTQEKIQTEPKEKSFTDKSKYESKSFDSIEHSMPEKELKQLCLEKTNIKQEKQKLKKEALQEELKDEQITKRREIKLVRKNTHNLLNEVKENSPIISMIKSESKNETRTVEDMFENELREKLTETSQIKSENNEESLKLTDTQDESKEAITETEHIQSGREIKTIQLTDARMQQNEWKACTSTTEIETDSENKAQKAEMEVDALQNEQTESASGKTQTHLIKEQELQNPIEYETDEKSLKQIFIDEIDNETVLPYKLPNEITQLINKVQCPSEILADMENIISQIRGLAETKKINKSYEDSFCTEDSRCIEEINNLFLGFSDNSVDNQMPNSQTGFLLGKLNQHDSEATSNLSSDFEEDINCKPNENQEGKLDHNQKMQQKSQELAENYEAQACLEFKQSTEFMPLLALKNIERENIETGARTFTYFKEEEIVWEMLKGNLSRTHVPNKVLIKNILLTNYCNGMHQSVKKSEKCFFPMQAKEIFLLRSNKDEDHLGFMNDNDAIREYHKKSEPESFPLKSITEYNNSDYDAKDFLILNTSFKFSNPSFILKDQEVLLQAVEILTPSIFSTKLQIWKSIKRQVPILDQIRGLGLSADKSLCRISVHPEDVESHTVEFMDSVNLCFKTPSTLNFHKRLLVHSLSTIALSNKELVLIPTKRDILEDPLTDFHRQVTFKFCSAHDSKTELMPLNLDHDVNLKLQMTERTCSTFHGTAKVQNQILADTGELRIQEAKAVIQAKACAFMQPTERYLDLCETTYLQIHIRKKGESIALQPVEIQKCIELKKQSLDFDGISKKTETKSSSTSLVLQGERTNVVKKAMRFSETKDKSTSQPNAAIRTAKKSMNHTKKVNEKKINFKKAFASLRTKNLSDEKHLKKLLKSQEIVIIQDTVSEEKEDWLVKKYPHAEPELKENVHLSEKYAETTQTHNRKMKESRQADLFDISPNIFKARQNNAKILECLEKYLDVSN